MARHWRVVRRSLRRWILNVHQGRQSCLLRYSASPLTDTDMMVHDASHLMIKQQGGFKAMCKALAIAAWFCAGWLVLAGDDGIFRRRLELGSDWSV